MHMSDSSESDSEPDSDNNNTADSDTSKSDSTPHYCYLMTNLKLASKITTHINTTTNPPIDFIAKNVQRHGKFKSIQWTLEMIIGPFTKDEAMRFKKEWQKLARGPPNRRDMGMRLCTKYDKTCWDARKIITQEEKTRMRKELVALRVPPILWMERDQRKIGKEPIHKRRNSE
jgi:hypothetical protein